jgi:membrane-bound serine protease (ClpP class)
VRDKFVADALFWSILLLLAGVGLIALELFLPSGGVLGILATLAIVGSLTVAFSGGWATGLSMLVATMVILPVVMAVAIHYWPRTPIGRLIVLETPSGDDEVLPDEPAYRQLKDLVGKRGVAKTKMLPSGAILIEGRVYDALSEGMAIDPGQAVRVTAVRTNRVVVVLDEAPPERFTESSEMLAQPARNLGLESLEQPLG